MNPGFKYAAGPCPLKLVHSESAKHCSDWIVNSEPQLMSNRLLWWKFG